MIPIEDREDQAILPEDRFTGIDFSELNVPAGGLATQDYPAEKKIQAALAFFMCGNTKKAARDVGITWSTLAKWRSKSPWWDEVQEKIRREKQTELDSMITNYLHEAQDAAMDRMQNGDFKMLASGKLVRIPMSGKDLALTSATFFDRRALIRGDATSIQKKQDPLAEIKGKLEAFAKFSNATQVEGKKGSADVTKMIEDGQRRNADKY